MNKKLNFGIIGAGHIANAMATTIMQMREVNMYAIGSRSIEKAVAYKEKYKMEKAYGSYDELVKDENVDVVYVATPHSFHYEHAKLCLENNKHVLCEKAFTANTAQAEQLIKIAEKKGLFIGEAMWTRFMPLIKHLRKLLDEKIIGDVTMMTANLNFPMLHKERLVKSELAGGALLDVGIYPLTIASIVMGDDIEKIVSTGILTESGVDKIGQYTITYKNGTMADLNSGMVSLSDGNAVIYGTGGYILLEGVNCPRTIRAFDTSWNNFLTITQEDAVQYYYQNGEKITGYEYEVEACAKAICSGKQQCDEMTHEQTIKIMKIMDEIRRQMGVKYSFE